MGDLDQLVACANMEGETMVATSYGYASWMGIDITPTFVINGKKKVLGLPKNFSDIVCEQLATTSTTLKGAAAVRRAEGRSCWCWCGQGPPGDGRRRGFHLNAGRGR